ncbi:hypothetical protein HS088_TW03G00838 [Tripterygium wilfordii]|uniref:Uncharacterized protein n=1 Tax=Tripterygium wilfordii TaxID=458696 RepID=A0A7J7DW22_TRIWF|nr:uncharacterized protein LOC119985250 [Tripterygium wilfordii]KAF5750501.1 hypothetical protein HS088_TW03G00838 [Tripterygium wilfordii]
MAFIAEDCAKHRGTTKVLTDIEEDEEELFEINIELVNRIPPPHYWESYFTATSDVLLANCLLPVADVSSAVPLTSKACNLLPMEAVTNNNNVLAVAEAMAALPGKMLGISTSWGHLGYMKKKPIRA